MKKIFFIIKAIVANIYYLFPSKGLIIIGITGTDGKTTTSNLIYQILSDAGFKTGIVSTVNAKIGKKEIDTGFHVTNPGPFQLQKLLREMKEGGCKYVVLEVTSHGLDQHRNFGIKFDIGVLTNITHEHLDYHKTFENYVRAKAKLFENSKVCIINKDYYKFFKKYIKNGQKIILYDKSTLNSNLSKYVNTKFKEEYNVMNATAAILTAKESGITEHEIAKGIIAFAGVEGRMQEIKNKRGLKIIVDFAHTPNALENLLLDLKKTKSKNSKLITVFGCAGERDIQKRPMMAKISSEIADISIFTAEDPRHEKVENIFSQMIKGVKNKNAKIYKIKDRRKAISFAINKIAKKGDIIAICGKGHEKSMNFNGIEYPWLDKEVVESILDKPISAIVLAAGKGSRMGGKIPKVLLSINRKSILHNVLNIIKEIEIDDVIVVAGFGSALVANEVKKIGYEVKIVKQGRKTGTAGATISGLKKISEKSDTVLIMYGDDSALYKKKTLQRFIKYHYSQNQPFSVAAIQIKGVSPLGGLEMNSDGDVIGVLGRDQLVSRGDKMTLVLCGLMCFDKNWLVEKIKLIPKNPKSGEYSIPYLFRIAYQEGEAIRPFLIRNDLEWNSINTIKDLEIARRKGENKWKK